MPVKFYMDAHFPRPITLQLRRREVDAITATEEGTNEIPDDQLLEIASSLKRLLVTFDKGFRVMAEDWQREGREFFGLVFVFSGSTSVRKLLDDLETIAKASDTSEYQNRILTLPLP